MHSPALYRDPNRLDYCDEPTRQAFEFVWSLSDETLLEALDNQKSLAYQHIRNKLSADTNPNWIMGAVGEEAYCRDILSEDDWDRIHRKHS